MVDQPVAVQHQAVGEILKQVSWWDAPVTTGHFRTGAGRYSYMHEEGFAILPLDRLWIS